jgi:hypothetical protein
MSPLAVKTAQSDEQHRTAGSERFKLEQDHTRALILDARTVALRNLEPALPQLTRLVAERGRLHRRLTMEQLGPTVCGCGTTMSSESPF